MSAAGPWRLDLILGRGDRMLTEGQWHVSSDPAAMLQHLRSSSLLGHGAAGWKNGAWAGRKARLLACAVYRQAWPRLPAGAFEEDMRDVTAAAEAYADGLLPPEDEMWFFSKLALRWSAYDLRPLLATRLPREMVQGLLSYFSVTTAQREPQSDTLRCLFGSPHRPCPPPDISPACRTLALAAYGSAGPDGALDSSHLAVLADAMEEAGCQPGHPALLHLRGPACRRCGGAGYRWLPSAAGRAAALLAEDVPGGPPAGTPLSRVACWACGGSGKAPHFKGCWVVDHVLGRGPPS